MILRDLKIEIVPIILLLDFAEKQSKEQYLKDIKSISTEAKFLLSAMKDAPKGADLQRAGQDWRISLEGMIKTIQFAVNYHNKDVTEAKMKELIESLNGDSLVQTIEIIYGANEVDAKKKLTTIL